MNHYDATNHQVNEAVKDNLVASFILNYLDQLDKEIEEPSLKVMRLQGRTLRYWLDGTSRMSPECFKDFAQILRVPLSNQEEELMNSMRFLDNYGGTQFFQSAIKEMDPSLAYTPDGQHMDQAGLAGGEHQELRQLSFAELHPELGLSAADYEHLTHKSMLKGSIGVYIKVIPFSNRIQLTTHSTLRTK